MAELIEIKLTPKQREELEAMVSRSSERAGLVRRARVILLTDAGVSGREIALRLDLSPEHVSRLRRRFCDEGAGLAERPKAGRKDHAVPAPMTSRAPDGCGVPACSVRQSASSRWSIAAAAA